MPEKIMSKQPHAGKGNRKNKKTLLATLVAIYRL